MTALRLFLLFFPLLLISTPSGAQKILDEYKKPMPEMNLLSKADFEAKTVLYQDTPFNDKALSFAVRLPQDWTRADDVGLSTGHYSLSSKVFGEVGRYYGPSRLMGTRSRFTVHAIELDYQLTAEQWFLQFLLSNGYTIQGMEIQGENQVEAMYVLMERDISYVVRAVCQINGKRVALAQYFLPVENWEDEKVMQAQSIGSFKLSDPESEFAEEMVDYQFLDIAELKYPKSWTLRALPVNSIERMKIELLNIPPAADGEREQKTLSGKIEILLVSAYSSDSIEAETDKLKKELVESGLTLKSQVRIKDSYNFNEAFEFAKVEAYEGIDSNDEILDYELWIASMLAGDFYYFLTLLTPSREDDYYTWSRNTQTFKLVVEQSKPQLDTLVAQ
ncbi:MAG: hypothetical protein K9G62_08640 [Alphaproteobacteria bacterium]|nr:hypothetical protein [Alphaproteobacteria bacterium]